MTTRPEPTQIDTELAQIDDAISRFDDPALAPNALLLRRYELRKALAGSNAADLHVEGARGRAFVIMPFKSPFDDYYAEVIRPAAIDAGFAIARSDEIYSPGAFVQTIWEQVVGADAIIAEMTGANANVLYELGLSHAIAKKVIMLTQRIEDVPSDLRHINCIVYDTTSVNWAEQTRNAIQRMLLFEPTAPQRAIIDPPASVDNTALFEEMLTEANALRRQLRTASRRAEAAAEQLRADRTELDALRAAAAGTQTDPADGPAITLHGDAGAPRAALRLPRSEEMLSLVYVEPGPFSFGIGGNAERVTLPGYWITQHSITTAQYCVFLNAFGNQEEDGALWIDLDSHSPADKCRIRFASGRFSVEPGYETHPVTYVNYYGAAAFCAWLGGGLPTVHEWEKAVRGVDGREYPWGGHPPNRDVANFGEEGWDRDVAPIDVRLKEAGASPFGVVQGIGNVWHWTRTHFPDRDVQAVRGGSYFDYRLGKRQVYRFTVHPDGPDFSQGFLMIRRFLAPPIDPSTAVTTSKSRKDPTR